MLSCSRQVFPRKEANRVDDSPCPNPPERALTCTDFGNTFHSRPQMRSKLREPTFGPEGISPVFRDRDRRNLTEHERQRIPRHSSKSDDSALLYGDVADVTFIDVNNE